MSLLSPSSSERRQLRERVVSAAVSAAPAIRVSHPGGTSGAHGPRNIPTAHSTHQQHSTPHYTTRSTPTQHIAFSPVQDTDVVDPQLLCVTHNQLAIQQFYDGDAPSRCVCVCARARARAQRLACALFLRSMSLFPPQPVALCTPSPPPPALVVLRRA